MALFALNSWNWYLKNIHFNEKITEYLFYKSYLQKLIYPLSLIKLRILCPYSLNVFNKFSTVVKAVPH